MGINKIVFPQANSVNKIIRMLINFDKKDITNKEVIMEKLEVVYRQSQYYIDAIRFIGIIDSNNNLTELGNKLMSFGNENQELCIMLRNAIVNRPVFKETYKYYIEHKDFPRIDVIAKQISEYFNLSGETPYRRASTVIKWIKWAVEVI